MSEGCPSCFQSARGQQQALEIAVNKAKDYAQEQQKSVAVYKEGYEYGYILASVAAAEGYQIVTVVSFNP